MFKSFKAGAMLGVVLPIGLLMSGCAMMTDGIGAAGVREVQHGNWQAAKVEFSRDYDKHPEHPIAVFNMGDSYHHDADLTQADAKFSKAASIGKTYEPDLFLEPDSNGATIASIACRHLHEDHRLDSNCGDQIALEAPPSPVTPPAEVAVAPQAAPAPEPAQSEAQATIVPEQPRKQDRN